MKNAISHPCEGHPNCCWQQRKWHLEWCSILPLRQQFCHSQCLHAVHNPLQQFKLWTWKVVSKVLLSIYKPTLYVWVFFLKVNLLGTTCHSCVLIPSHLAWVKTISIYEVGGCIMQAKLNDFNIKFKKWYINQEEDSRN